MQKITREQAEQFFNTSEVIKSLVEQNSEELRISFNLSSQDSIMVIYNTALHEETYFLNNPPLKNSR
jgi:hypothetical protein